MKYKYRITEVVLTSSHGKKCPMAYVEKSKQPNCFINYDDNEFNHRYTSNKIAWFNCGVTQWWLQDVSAP